MPRAVLNEGVPFCLVRAMLNKDRRGGRDAEGNEPDAEGNTACSQSRAVPGADGFTEAARRRAAAGPGVAAGTEARSGGSRVLWADARQWEYS